MLRHSTMNAVRSAGLIAALMVCLPELPAEAARGGRMGGGSFRSSRTSYRSSPSYRTRTTTTTTYRTTPAPTRTVYVPVQTPPPRTRLGDAVRTGAAVAGGVVAGNMISDAIRRPVVQAAPGTVVVPSPATVPTPAAVPVPAMTAPAAPLATVQTVDNWWGGFWWGGGLALLLSWFLGRRR